MGLFGKGFGTGLAEGLATGASRTIQTALDKREEEASAARRYMQTRRMQEAERYEQDMEETSELFDGFVQLTGGDMDKAAQLMKGAGGTEASRSLLTSLQTRVGEDEDFNVLTAYTFAEAQAGEFGRDDYLRTLVRDPKSLALPQSKKIGLGLADKILGAEAKDMGIAMPELRGAKIEGLGTATLTPGAMRTTEQEIQEKAAEASLRLTEARIDDIYDKMETKNALSFTEYGSAITKSMRDAMNPFDIPVDDAGNFSLDTAQDKIDNLGEVWTRTIQSATRQGLAAKGTLAQDGNLQQLLNKAALKDKAGNYVVTVNPLSEEDKPVLGSVYNLKNQSTGLDMPHLYLGPDIGFTALP